MVEKKLYTIKDAQVIGARIVKNSSNKLKKELEKSESNLSKVEISYV